MAKFNFQRMALVEDYVLEQIGQFVVNTTGLPVFLMDQPWPAKIEPSIGMSIIDYRTSGSSDTTNITDNRYEAVTDLRMVVEFFARSGRPMSNLALLIQALKGFKEERYQTLYSKGIGFLDVGNAVPANTVFDGNETEKRARVTAVFNIRVQALDTVRTSTIETIKGSIFTNEFIGEELGAEEAGFSELYDFYNGPFEGSIEVEEKLKRGLRTAVSQTFNVEFKTT